jgi:hypothetical protein
MELSFGIESIIYKGDLIPSVCMCQGFFPHTITIRGNEYKKEKIFSAQ